MAREELEAALRRDGEQQAREIWRQVEEQAVTLRKQTDEEVQRLQQAANLRCQQEVTAFTEEKRAAARKTSQSCRLQTEQALSRRLKTLAQELLEDLANGGGDRLFNTLAAEIPDHDWSRVVVNPRDRHRAAQRFPDADIQVTERITGGLEVAADEGRLQVINTLEKRLEHLWPEILPEMMRDLREKAGENEAVTDKRYRGASR